jgi:hypothetical protein
MRTSIDVEPAALQRPRQQRPLQLPLLQLQRAVHDAETLLARKRGASFVPLMCAVSVCSARQQPPRSLPLLRRTDLRELCSSRAGLRGRAGVRAAALTHAFLTAGAHGARLRSCHGAGHAQSLELGAAGAGGRARRAAGRRPAAAPPRCDSAGCGRAAAASLPAGAGGARRAGGVGAQLRRRRRGRHAAGARGPPRRGRCSRFRRTRYAFLLRAGGSAERVAHCASLTCTLSAVAAHDAASVPGDFCTARRAAAARTGSVKGA